MNVALDGTNVDIYLSKQFIYFNFPSEKFSSLTASISGFKRKWRDSVLYTLISPVKS